MTRSESPTNEAVLPLKSMHRYLLLKMDQEDLERNHQAEREKSF
jgi:hypothetical protein